MFEKVAEDLYWATMLKLASLEKDAASNLRSDLVLGRLSDATKNKLMHTRRYHFNNPGQILADIKSMLRGKGNDVGALTQELKNRGIDYKVRGKGLSPKDIELDFSKGHDNVLNTPYLPSNYSDSFVDNNVNRRFNKAVNSANKAGYNDLNINEEYINPGVGMYDSSFIDKKSGPIEVAIPAKTIEGRNELQFDKRNAGPILHETNEINRNIQKDKYYDRTVKNIEQDPSLQTTGKYPGVIVPQQGIQPLRLFDRKNNISPYNNTGRNSHASATILMNELMDQNALQVGINPEPGSINDIFSIRKEGPYNPVNMMTGIDLTSQEQPFVPRSIAKNKKEYLKRIRAVRKAEDALQKEYLRKRMLFDSGTYDPQHPIEEMIDDQVRAAVRKESEGELFKEFPQTIKFNDINDLDQFLQKNPVAKDYIEKNHKDISERLSSLPSNANEVFLKGKKYYDNDDIPAFTDDEFNTYRRAANVIGSANKLFNRNLDDLVFDKKRIALIKLDNYINNMKNKYNQRITGDSQQNMDFLVNYLRSRGFPVE